MTQAIRLGIAPVLLTILTLSLTGCIPNKFYRKDMAIETNPGVNLERDCPSEEGPSPGGFTGKFDLAFLEFDDMGELWDQCNLDAFADGNGNCQMQKALQLIQRRKQEGNVAVVTFVHGWNNNASPHNERHDNLCGFKRILAVLGSAEAQSSQARPTRVIGVYMAWRGKALPGFLTYPTVLNRRDAARRVSGASFTEAVYRLMYTTKEQNADGQNSDSKEQNRFIIIGHSFGGLILERAITQPFIALLLEHRKNELDKSAPSRPVTFSSPADLVIFLNSANDAMETKQMLEMMKRYHLRADSGPEGQLPVAPLFISMTSVGDKATGSLPILQYLASPTKSFREYDKENQTLERPRHSQRYYFAHTAAFVDSFISHELVPRQDLKFQDCGRRPESQSTLDQIRVNKNHTCYQLKATGKWNDTPYWIMKLPKGMVPDHSAIFKDDLLRFLSKILQTYVKPQGRVLTMQ